MPDRKARDARYNHSPKGRARWLRYRHSAKGERSAFYTKLRMQRAAAEGELERIRKD